jgi:GMP synthase PP-ATPase subunit
LNEGDQVMETFAEAPGREGRSRDAADEFFGALAGVADPEAKRKIIGRLFVEVFQREAKKLPEAKWLAQGTDLSRRDRVGRARRRRRRRPSSRTTTSAACPSRCT